MDYTIYAAKADESNEGWVWFEQPDLPTRTLVKIQNPQNGRTVFCQSRKIDANFLRSYNQPPRISITTPAKALVIGEWYRIALGGFSTTQHSRHDENLLITRAKLPLWASVRAGCHHPEIVARIGTRLGVLGIWLGVAGIAAPILEFLELGKCPKLIIFLAIAAVTAAVGFLACRGVKS